MVARTKSATTKDGIEVKCGWSLCLREAVFAVVKISWAKEKRIYVK